MTGIIVTIPPTVEVPPGNNASNPSSLPGVTYTFAILGLGQTWTAKQTFPLGMISLNAADITGTLPAGGLPLPTASTLGAIFSKANVSHKWINSIGTDGTPTSTQPDAADVSFTQAGTGAVARFVSGKIGEIVSVKDFGAVGDGATDDTTAIQAAITSLTAGGIVWLPRGTYKVTSQLNIAVSGVCLRGEGRGATVISSSASGHTIQIATGLSYVEIRDMQTTRSSFPAISGQDGIHFTGNPERALVDNVEVSRHWEGIRCGITGFSKLTNNLVNNCYSNGIRITNADGAGGLQWTLINNLCQQCNGWGVLYESPSGNASVGEIINQATFANKLGGMAFKGTDASHALNAIRIHGGFCGQDGSDEVFFDTYGSSTHTINGMFLELAGTSTCGVDLGTAITNVGHGFNATANNTAISLTDNNILGNSYSGVSSNATRLQATGNNLRINGAAAVGGETSGFLINAGNATIVGNSIKGQAFGVSLANDNHVVVGNDLSENTTAPLSAGVNLITSVVEGNIPTSAAIVRPVTTIGRGDSIYTISQYDDLVFTNAAFTAARVWTLPAANSVKQGKRIKIADWQGTITATNTLTVQRAGADTVNGGTSIVLANAFDGVTLESDGTSKWTFPVVGVEQGGTGATSASAARTNLGVAGGQLPATATNDNASSGNLGEYISSTIASGSAVALTNNTQANITSISLTAGDWDIDAVAQFTGAATTTVSSQEASISTTSATLDYTGGKGVAITGNSTPYNQIVAASAIGIPVPPIRMSLSATTTVYLVARSIFATSTSSVYGILRARRVR